jgi:hypothetical protein
MDDAPKDVFLEVRHQLMTRAEGMVPWCPSRSALLAEACNKCAPIQLADAAARQFVDDVNLPRCRRGVQSLRDV